MGCIDELSHINMRKGPKIVGQADGFSSGKRGKGDEIRWINVFHEFHTMHIGIIIYGYFNFIFNKIY